MTLVLTLDPDDPTPPYEQLRRQLGDLIAAGRLGPGDRLPPLRQLAGDLGVAVGTVARSYRELEQEGLLTSRRGGGTRVAESGRAPAVNRQEMLEGMAADFVARVRGLGYTDDETVAALERQLRL
ncbi:GntR family transcriptional regulator [Tessaracoccus flavus]|uniref:GntR family transcriptional regulator n=1 Tax=Tessaracoccus flavus TaxID=1610493 RepID=A0A1Q2CDW5_9ACTN|nr:GntR family transcriptional regulator [Tessaracoccus flavus]AQP44235.1 GntR family transcriptional regulator [Tessaracoccus flavus]SDY39121.1 transcriptional regulator, GntR family [Tessaracoccus flavus]